MKRILLLCISPLVLFCGCTAENTDTASTPVIINLPKDNSVNGYRNGTASNTAAVQTGSMPDTIKAEDTAVVSALDTESTSKNYCGNKNSKVFHSASCGSVTNMKEANKVYLKDRNEFVSQGYKPCSRCNP